MKAAELLNIGIDIGIMLAYHDAMLSMDDAFNAYGDMLHTTNEDDPANTDGIKAIESKMELLRTLECDFSDAKCNAVTNSMDALPVGLVNSVLNRSSLCVEHKDECLREFAYVIKNVLINVKEED